MIVEHEDIRAYFENLITSRLNFAAENSGFDLSDKLVVANESYDGKTRKDIIVVLKFLSAENTNGVVDLPIQVMVEVKSELQDLIFNILQDIAYDLNQTIGSIADPNIQNAVKYKFKQFYNTPLMLSHFQNAGAYKTSAMTMDARFVVFDTISTLGDMELTLLFNSNYYPSSTSDKSIDNFKNTIINTVFHVEYAFDGRVKNQNPVQENLPNSYNANLTINYILDSNDTIQSLFDSHLFDGATFQITYRSAPSFTNKTFKYHIQSYTENLLVSDVTKVTIVFITTGE